MISMIKRIYKSDVVNSLFHNWNDTMVWSCLQNTMGEIYVKKNNPVVSAMAHINDFCFLAGAPDKELLTYRPDLFNKEFIIMIPQNLEWDKYIEECYAGHFNRVIRYATKKEYNIFEEEKLQNIVNSLLIEYKLVAIDRERYEQCKSSEWCYSLVSAFDDYEEFCVHGLGYVIVKDNTIVSGAASYSFFDHGIEIEIDTEEKYRRNGLALTCGAKLILECNRKHLYPSWDAQNQGSLALAQKLGYHFNYSYHAYEIFK